MEKPGSHHLIKRLIAPVTVWAVTKLLDTPSVKKRMQKIDAKTYLKKRQASRVLRRAGRNATRNRSWFAAGAAVFALGIGLMAKATRAK
jgi:hypothetical protein